MGEYQQLMQQGVYCESCGCYTGQEPGHPVKCEGCAHDHDERTIESLYERGETL